ncbi:MAG: M1 family metallopeptidase [Sphingobacteriales bacterium JAD_PAG50586_3]|nr:MAG: M1 family metallopeptidase [Sphingobacteriales bacterium JAD_PAG50586_3]
MALKKLLLLTGLALSAGLSAQTYFQQEVDYKIDVKLNTSKDELSAFETIEYKNNSTQTLTFIWFHLWPNAYKDNSTALAKQFLLDGDTKFYYAEDKDRGYIDSLNFTSNGIALKLEYHPQHIDIAKVHLAKPLAPGESVTISTPFKVKVPVGIFSRLGHIGKQYQITQWYPKPAVYDNKGWHEMPYLNQGEFYSEFGSFEVKITVPDNYVVAATGDLQEKSEMDWLEQRVKDSQRADFKPDTTISSKYKTITYKQTNVHDFAWFADHTYLVSKSEVKLPASGRTVNTYAYYTRKYKKLWEKAPTYINDAVFYYSKWNGDYPYNHCSAVDGALSAGGGMEYPNVTVIGAMNSDLSLETVIMHEVGHNWFYGILGSNERDHGWMDEGINSFNEMRYLYTKYPEKGIELGIPQPILNAAGLGGRKNRYQYYLAYLFSKRQNIDQPIQTHSADFTQINYATIMYMKTATAFDYLKAYLGDSTFDNCMHKYYDKWKFKHPQPEDLRKIFEDETGKKLDWFFDDLINTTKRVDYKIRMGKKGNVIVTNRGEIAGPFPITTTKDGKVVETTLARRF